MVVLVVGCSGKFGDGDGVGVHGGGMLKHEVWIGWPHKMAHSAKMCINSSAFKYSRGLNYFVNMIGQLIWVEEGGCQTGIFSDILFFFIFKTLGQNLTSSLNT